MGNLKLSKTAIRELTRLYRGVLIVAFMASAVIATGVKAEYEQVNLNGTGTATSTIKYTDNQIVTWTDESILLTPTSGRAITASFNGSKNHYYYTAPEPTIFNLGGENTENITITTHDDGVLAFSKGLINLRATDTIRISTDVADTDCGAVWAQNSSDPGQSDGHATIDLKADKVILDAAGSNAVVAMSEGIVKIEGNTTLTGKNAILTRGYAETHINTAGDKTVVMEGDIAFDYDDNSSKTAIDATVDVTLNGSESSWTGNTIVSYDKKPEAEKLQVRNATINLKNGANWNATAVKDASEATDTNDYYYTALNNLNVNVGTINVADATHGVTVENLKASGLTVTGEGIVNVTKTIDTTDNKIDDYSTKVKLANGVEIKGDINFIEGTADQYAAETGAEVKYKVGNLIGSVGKGEQLIQVVSSGATVNVSDAKWTSENGATFISSGANDGKMVVKGFDGGIDGAAEQSGNVQHTSYEQTADETVTTNLTLHNDFELKGQGNDPSTNPTLNLTAQMDIAEGASFAMDDAIIDGTGGGQIKVASGAKASIKDSYFKDLDIKIDGEWESDPTTYDHDTVTNNGIATFVEDTFINDSVLANNGVVNFADVDFSDPTGSSSISGTGVINLISGTTAFNTSAGTTNTNTIKVANGAKFSGIINGGVLDTRNGTIETAGLGSIVGDAYVDGSLATGTIDAITGGTVKGVTLSSSAYSATGSSATLSSGSALFGSTIDVEGNNYFTKMTVSDDNKKVTFSDKLMNTSGVHALLGDWGTSSPNHISASTEYDADTDSYSTTPGQTVGEALTALDTVIGAATFAADTVLGGSSGSSLGDGSGTTQTVADALGTLNTALSTLDEIKAGNEGDGAHVAVEHGATNAAEMAADANDGTSLWSSNVETNATTKKTSISAEYYEDKDATTTPTSAASIVASIESDNTSKVAITADKVQVNGADVLTTETTMETAGTNYLATDTIRGAISKLDGAIGDLSGLATTDQSSLVAAINELDGSKQDTLVIADNSGLQMDTDGKTLSIKLADTTESKSGLKLTDNGLSVKLADTTESKSGLQIGDNGLSIKVGDTMTITNQGFLNMKYGSEFTSDGNGLKLNTNAITIDKLAQSVYTDTVGTGSSEKLATTAAVKNYADSAVSNAITFNSDNTVTLKVGSNSAAVYNKTGTEAAIKSQAESADYTGKLVDGTTTSTGSINAAIENTNAQVRANVTNIAANKDAIDLLNDDVDVAGSVLYMIDNNAETAKFTLANYGDGVDLTASDTTLGAALYKLDTTKAGLAQANKFEAVNTFEAGIILGDDTASHLATTLSTNAKGLTIDQELAVAGLSNLNGGIAVGGDKFTVGTSGATSIADTLDVAGVTTLSSTNGLRFGTAEGTPVAKSIAAATATTFDASALATTKNIDVLAEKATFTVGSALNIKEDTTDSGVTTLGGAINQLDTVIGDIAGLSTTNGNLSQDDVATSLATIDTHMGNITAFTGSTTGNISNSKPGEADNADNISTAIANIDATLGQIHGLKDVSDLGDKSNLAAGTTVRQHLVSLDNAVGDLTQLANGQYVAGSRTAADAVMALDNNLNRVESHVDAIDNRVNKMHHEMKSGFASLAAMSALVPNARVAGDTQIAVGTGYYRGTTGFALGAFHHINDNVLLNAGASYAGNGSAVFKGGVTFGF